MEFLGLAIIIGGFLWGAIHYGNEQKKRADWYAADAQRQRSEGVSSWDTWETNKGADAPDEEE